jgi:hypothetical protein
MGRDGEGDPLMDRAVAIMDKATETGSTDLIEFMLPFS